LEDAVEKRVLEPETGILEVTVVAAAVDVVGFEIEEQLALMCFHHTSYVVVVVECSV